MTRWIVFARRYCDEAILSETALISQVYLEKRGRWIIVIAIGVIYPEGFRLPRPPSAFSQRQMGKPDSGTFATQSTSAYEPQGMYIFIEVKSIWLRL